MSDVHHGDAGSHDHHHEPSHGNDHDKSNEDHHHDNQDPDAPDALPVFTIAPPPIGRQYSQTTTYSSVAEEPERCCDVCCTIL